MGRIAAVDFGLKRIGLAVSDKEKKIALSVGMIDGGKNAALHIVKALPMKEVEKILVGLPLLMSGKKGDMALLVEKFAQDLEAAAQVPIILWDERLSSKQADAMLKEISLKRKKRTEKLDAMAAAVLLQSYLDSLKML